MLDPLYTPIDLPTAEPNDSFETASAITEGSYTVHGTGIDWFHFDTVSGQMSFTMTPADAFDLNLELHNAAGDLIKSKITPTQESFTFIAPQDGSYYLKIYRAQYPGAPGAAPPADLPLDYQLDISLPVVVPPGPNDPGETMATASAISDGTQAVVGTGVDWFKFETGPGRINLTMTPTGDTGQNLNMVLYDTTGKAIASGFTRTGSESFEYLATTTDTFYINVVNAAYPSGTPNGISMTYDLNVSLPKNTFSLGLDFGPIGSTSIGVFDIDNDGRDEIIFGTDKLLDSAGNEVMPAGLVVLEDTGAVKWTHIFPGMTGPDPLTGKTYTSTSVSTAPVFSDVNGDGKIDIVVGVGAGQTFRGSVGQPGDKGGVYALNADGSVIWYHQTKDTFGDDNRPDGVYDAPTVFDIDGDGVREVIFASWDHYLYVLDGRTGALEKQTHLHDTSGAAPTIADLNNDGLVEIIMPADISPNTAGLPTHGGILHVFNNQLYQTVAGWTSQIGSSTSGDLRGKFDEQVIWSTAQVADLNRDGKLEIIVGTGNFFQDDRGQYIKVWNADGTLRHQLATDGRTLASPLIADLNGDGSPEIIAGTMTGHVYAWSANGTLLFDTQLAPYGTPAGTNALITRSPTAVDLDGDGKLEILVSAGSQVNILSSTGKILTSTTQPELVHFGYSGSPIAKDIDGDGKLDIITGGRDPVTNQAVIFRFENIFDTTADHYDTAKYQEVQSLNNIHDFVERFYSTILGRSADPGGLNNWTDFLHTGVRSGGDVARSFIHSVEFTRRNTNDAEFLTTLYTAFFDRAPDPGGFSSWSNKLSNGYSRDDVLESFIGSREFKNLTTSFGIRAQNLTGAVSNADVITGGADSDFLRGNAGANTIFDEGTSVLESRLNEAEIYSQVYRLYHAALGRDPDTNGFTGWFDGLKTGRITLEQSAGAFVSSREFQKVYGSLNNTQFVELLYHNVLGRASDPGGLANWTARLDDGASRASILLSFSESKEFRRNSTPELDDFMRLRNPVWNDAIEGGAGDDTMNGGIGSDTFIFRSGQGGADVIEGFEAWDNLQLSGFGFKTAADARARMTQNGADVVFDYLGQSILFTNTKLADMARVRYNLS